MVKFGNFLFWKQRNSGIRNLSPRMPHCFPFLQFPDCPPRQQRIPPDTAANNEVEIHA